MSFKDNFIYFMKLYWRSVFIIFYPLVLLPIFMAQDYISNRCIYVIVLMVGFWITEALPIPVTSLFPVAFYPLMGILSSKDTTLCYITEYLILMVCATMISLAMELSNLHLRISLIILKLIGFSPRKLHIVFTVFTMFVSMWINDTATTALVVPIALVILKELEEQGIGRIFEEGQDQEMDIEGPDEIKRRPTRSTIGYFISIAYASSIGSTGYLTGNISNLYFKEVYDKKYNETHVNSGYWILFCVPFMLLTMFLTFVIIEIFYMGLFRPKSSAAQEFRGNITDTSVARANVVEKLQALGPMTFHEIVVAILLLLAILLWFFRQSELFYGWADHWAPYNTVIRDSSAGVLVLVIMFLLPKTSGCCYTFSPDEEKKPIKHSNGIMTWKYSLRKVPWSLMFVIGAGYAISEGSYNSDLSEQISKDLEDLQYYSPIGILAMFAMVAIVMTQLAPNDRVCKVLLPVIIDVTMASGSHPLYIMWPTTIACNMAFLFQVATPPNALVASYINLPTLEMLKVGSIIAIVSYLMILFIFGVFLPLLVDVNYHPSAI